MSDTNPTQEPQAETLYELTDEARECLEAALNIVAQASTLQYNETARKGMLSLCETLADFFDIPVQYLEDDELDEDETPEPESGTLH